MHTEAKIALDDWYTKTEKAEWSCFADVKNMFNAVDSIGNKRFVFNIKSNSFRLIALILFTPKIVYIRYIGTHADYNKIDNYSKL